MALQKLDEAALVDDITFALASLNELADTADPEHYDLAWTRLRGVLHRLNERLNQGDLDFLDCSLSHRPTLSDLWKWLQDWNGVEKPQFGAEAKQYFTRVSAGATSLLYLVLLVLGWNDKQHRTIPPEVDLKLNQVRYAGECYNVTADGALLMDLLVKARPDYIPASKHFSKPSDVKDALPEPLRSLIETQSAKGYRLKFD